MYSIIIPHRNTSRLLERLLQSIPWKHSPQVIVVDNKSTADELRAVESLRSSYHFSLYSSSGCGAGDARNVGLRHADGEWVLFADSDDYYLPDADQLISSHIDDDADIVFFNVTSAFSDSGARAYRDRSVKGLLKRYHKEHENTDVMRCLYTNPWGKMIRRRLITENHLVFEDIVSGNDVYFSVTAGLAARSVVVDERELYCVTVRQQSVTSTVDKEHIESNGQSRLRINRLLRERGYGRYQLSVLYYIGMSRAFGWRFLLHAFCASCRYGNRPWVGIGRLFFPSRWGGVHHNRS